MAQEDNNTRDRDNNSSKRGFAAMKENDPERQKEIARQGGQIAHQSGRAHEFNSDTGREAGRKSRSGGQGGNNRDDNSEETQGQGQNSQ